MSRAGGPDQHNHEYTAVNTRVIAGVKTTPLWDAIRPDPTAAQGATPEGAHQGWPRRGRTYALVTPSYLGVIIYSGEADDMDSTESGNGAHSSIVEELDVLVVGAGFAGLYQLDRLRRLGFS